MDAKTVEAIKARAPAPESDMECGRRLGYEALAQSKRTVAKGACSLVCAYLKENPDASLVAHDGAVFDAAPETPVKVADVASAAVKRERELAAEIAKTEAERAALVVEREALAAEREELEKQRKALEGGA